jgi:hypothetical protein
MVEGLGVAVAVAKEIGSIDKLLSNLINIDYLVIDNLEKRRIRKVVQQLNYIYFSKNGVRRALEMINTAKNSPSWGHRLPMSRRRCERKFGSSSTSWMQRCTLDRRWTPHPARQAIFCNPSRR